MTAKQNKLITEYLNYFLWFLEKKLTREELDYMLYLRDRLEKERVNLGDIDLVWKSQASMMLKYPTIFKEALSDSWWWKKSEWEKLEKSSSRSAKKSYRSVAQR